MIKHLKNVLDAIDGDERFVLAAAVLVVGVVLVASGPISGSEFVTLMLGTVAVFISGSSYSSGVEARAAASVAINKESEAGETERA